MAQLAAFGLPNLSTSFSVSPLAAVGPLPASELLVFLRVLTFRLSVIVSVPVKVWEYCAFSFLLIINAYKTLTQ